MFDRKNFYLTSFSASKSKGPTYAIRQKERKFAIISSRQSNVHFPDYLCCFFITEFQGSINVAAFNFNE